MEFAPIFPLIQPALKSVFPTCLWEGCSEGKAIALTFDDGPHPRYTPALLDCLDKHHVTASFFWLGECVERSPAIARTAYNAGHWVGLHGYTHKSFPWLSTPELKQSLEQTQEAIARACNLDRAYVAQHVRDVRPPNGFFTPQILTQFHTWGYRPVMWSVVPEDWVRPGVEVVVERIRNQIREGSLIVLHDGYHGGEDVVAIVDRIVPMLRDVGYEFVTINQLWQTQSLNERSTIISG